MAKKYSTTAYDKLYKDYAKGQDKVVAQQTKQATDDASAKLREAYISRMQNQKTLNDNLASAGLRGGITETSNIYVPLFVTTKELPEMIILLALEVTIILPGCNVPLVAQVCEIPFLIYVYPGVLLRQFIIFTSFAGSNQRK